MRKTIVASIVLVVALIGCASAANIRKTCSGQWTDMRVIGLTLGDCDLNDVSSADRQYVRHRCGEPWTPEQSEKRTAKACAITVIAGPRRPNGRGALVYPVRRVVRH